ncbi:5-oxoprolinase subunit PxpB [Orbaceae bacterium ESL0727]|nr:5-oxoprolinase subunit PxpB [Orbaceae bacterium ESL0727]
MNNKKIVSPDPHFYLLGEKAVVIAFSPPISLEIQRRIWALAKQLSGLDEVVEVVPGMNNLTVLLTYPQRQAAPIINKLKKRWEGSHAIEVPTRCIDIYVTYGKELGPDLPFVAKHCGMTEKQVVECHASSTYTVYFIGFQPGFAYLGDMPAALHTPRRAEPRLAVPQGSIAIGGSQTGIYPLVTPGGWQLIGQTQQPLFDPTAASPTLLQPGDTIRFIPNPEGVC